MTFQVISSNSANNKIQLAIKCKNDTENFLLESLVDKL